MRRVHTFAIIMALCGIFLSGCSNDDSGNKITDVTLPELSWEQMSGPQGGSVYCMAETPNGDLFISTGSGILRSTDDGDSWESVLETDGRTVGELLYAKNHLVAFASGGIIYRSQYGEDWEMYHAPIQSHLSLAQSQGNDLYISSYEGIFRSSDDGATWVSFPFSLEQPNTTELNIHITMDNTFYVAAPRESRLYRSNDNGTSWQDIDLTPIPNSKFFHVFSDPSSNIYLWWDPWPQDARFYYSSNGGREWDEYLRFPAMKYFRGIKPMPSGNGYYISTEQGFYRTEDNGHTWTHLPTDIEHRATFFIHVTESNNLFMGTELGLIKSQDNGNTWVLANSFISTSIIQVSVDNNHIFASMYENVFYKNKRDNSPWKLLPVANTNYTFYTFEITKNGNLLYGTGEGLFVSTDFGATWRLPVRGNATFVLPYASNQVLLELNGNIFYSSNDGVSWSEISPPRGNDLERFSRMAVNDQNHIYVGINHPENRLVRSTDNGQTWESLPNITDIHSQAINEIQINSKNSIFVNGYYGLFRSDDGGYNWIQLNYSIPLIWDLVIDSHDRLYAATRNGVFVSIDDGETWTELEDGLYFKKVWDLALDDQGYLYAGTDGKGVFRTVLPVD